MSVSVSEEHVATVYGMKEQVKQEAISAGSLLHAGFMLALIFEPEDGSDMLLQNVGWLSWTTWRYLPKYRIQQKEFLFCDIS
jgi:hypothetical protein